MQQRDNVWTLVSVKQKYKKRFSDNVTGDNLLALKWCQIVATFVAGAQR